MCDPARKTNRVGTDRKYIGTSLFVCDACGEPVKPQCRMARKSLCSGHLTRDHKHVDRYVIEVIAERLAQPHVSKLLAPVGDEMKPVVAESKKLRARLEKIDNEYDEGIIDGPRWRSAKEKVAAQLRDVDKKLAAGLGGAALGAVAGAADPAQAFRDASLMAKRSVIDALCTVRLRRATKGRMPSGMWIDYTTVDIAWRR